MGKSNKKSRKQGSSSLDPQVTTPLIVVLPGDDVTEHILLNNSKEEETITESSSSSNKLPKLGVGLRFHHHTKRITATCAGKLEQHRNNKTYFIQQNTKRYIPSLEDRVVGIVEDRIGSDGAGGDLYRINIGGPHPALLSSLSFEGATKRNKPHLSSGVLLYARVSQIFRNGMMMDPVLSCQVGPHDIGVHRKDWMTNEGTYGELKGGTVMKVSLGLARELLRPHNIVLDELAHHGIAFELAVGVNGYVWIHSTQPQYTICIQNAILNSEVLTEPQVRGMVKNLVYTVQKQLQQEMDG